MNRVLVIGAGASGLMAALSAARAGAKVTVLEHGDKPGRKLALTGNGRCNYTNTDVNVSHYHSFGDYDYSSEKFIRTVLDEFGYEDCIAFFRELGIEPDIRHYQYDDSGYVYPEGMNAAEFRDVVYNAAVNAGVKFEFGVDDAEVLRIAEDDKYHAVVIAAGSNAYPATGSDSSIYPLLKKIGAEFHIFQPALCALYSKDAYLREMKGKRIKDTVCLNIYRHNLLDKGDMHIGHNRTEQASGKNISEDISAAGKYGPASCSKSSLTPGRDDTIIDDAGVRLITDSTETQVLSHKAYGEVQFNEHSISGIPVMQLSRYAAIALKQGLKVSLTAGGHEYDIHRTAGFDRSQVCSGGIDLRDIDPHTMRFKDSNVYICGELLDVDGDCGGYNLHFAWATGYIAGRSAGACGCA